MLRGHEGLALPGLGRTLRLPLPEQQDLNSGREATPHSPQGCPQGCLQAALSRMLMCAPPRLDRAFLTTSTP